MSNPGRHLSMALALLFCLAAIAASKTAHAQLQTDAMGFVGPVIALPNTANFVGDWRVGNRTVHVSPVTVLNQELGRIALGALVEVQGPVRQDGSIEAIKIRVIFAILPPPSPSPHPSPNPAPPCLSFLGVVEALPANGTLIGDWRVTGHVVHVTSSTTIRQEQGSVAVGSFVEVKGCVGTDHTITASLIEVKKRPTVVPLPSFIFFGIVQTLPNTDNFVGDWMVNGRTVHVTAQTHIEQPFRPLVVGALVRIAGDLRIDNSVDARSVVVLRNNDPSHRVNFFELHGEVKALPTTPNLVGDWKVSALTVHVGERTQIIQPAGHPVTIGSKVLVVGLQKDDLTVNAVRIVVLRPVSTTQNFVSQNYSDFLNRDPDPSGLAFWSNEIDSCQGDAGCIDAKRVNTSAAFFLSIEFQSTGYLVYKSYVASFGRMPRLTEFLPDVQAIGQNVTVGAPAWEETINANKLGFAGDWVEHPAFTDIYDNKSDSQYVDMLFANAGVTANRSDRDALVAGLSDGSETRATVLLKVVNNPTFDQAEFNRAFVLMQYFGYLRRDPDSGPDTNMDGFNFWLNKLNQFNGDFNKAEMVRSFILSGEYNSRFEPR